VESTSCHHGTCSGVRLRRLDPACSCAFGAAAKPARKGGPPAGARGKSYYGEERFAASEALRPPFAEGPTAAGNARPPAAPRPQATQSARTGRHCEIMGDAAAHPSSRCLRAEVISAVAPPPAAGGLESHARFVPTGDRKLGPMRFLRMGQMPRVIRVGPRGVRSGNHRCG